MLYPSTCVGLRYGWRRAWRLADFLGSMITGSIGLPRRGLRTLGPRPVWGAVLPAPRPAPVYAGFRPRAAVPLLRPRVAARRQSRNVDRVSVGLAARLSLRTRLTPG